MLAELFNEFVRLGRDAEKVEIVDFDARRKLVRQGARLEFHDNKPAPRTHLVETFDSFTDAVGKWAEGTGVVWHSPGRVQLVVDDDGDRLDLVTVALTYSEPFKLLKQIAATKHWLDHRDFVRMLRFDLPDCFHEEFVRAVRAIDFTDNVNAGGSFQNGRDSFGKSVETAVNNLESFERFDRVVAKVRVYEQDGWFGERHVLCTFDIDPGPRKLMLRPLPGQIEQAIDDTHATIQAALVEKLAKLEVAVFRGTK
jgi:hypothetical protein